MGQAVPRFAAGYDSHREVFMTLEELQYLVKEACDTYGCGNITIDNLPPQMTEAETGEWEDDGKYQHRSDVYVDDQTPPNHFMILNTRSGSYFTDYQYGEPAVMAVKPVVETITRVVWKRL